MRKDFGGREIEQYRGKGTDVGAFRAHPGRAFKHVELQNASSLVLRDPDAGERHHLHSPNARGTASHLPTCQEGWLLALAQASLDRRDGVGRSSGPLVVPGSAFADGTTVCSYGLSSRDHRRMVVCSAPATRRRTSATTSTRKRCCMRSPRTTSGSAASCSAPATLSSARASAAATTRVTAPRLGRTRSLR